MLEDLSSSINHPGGQSSATERSGMSLSYIAYTNIKHKIVTLELAPGSIIDETSLRSELKLGRTPIREALLRLSLENLVIIVPRRGIFVSEISIPHVQQLFEMRLALEPLAASLAAERITGAYIQQLDTALDVKLENYPSPSAAYIHADQSWHKILYEAAGNKYLETSLNALYTLSLRLWNYSRVIIDDLHSALTLHQQVVLAIKNNDSDLAHNLLERHVRVFQEEIQKAMLSLPGKAKAG